MGNDPRGQQSTRKGVAATKQLEAYLNPTRPAWRNYLYTILYTAMVKFIFLMLVIFSLYVLVFVWAKFDQDTCEKIWQYRGETTYWLENCIELREQ
jgi:hypothetical protein